MKELNCDEIVFTRHTFKALQVAVVYQKLALSEYGFKSDIIATITNSHKNPNTRFIFRDCFPTGLGSVELDVNGTCKW